MRGVAEQPPREERPSLVRRIALSYWTVILIGALVLAAHARFWFSHPGARAENLSGFGASLIVLGLMVAARPFIRSGLAVTVGQAMPPLLGVFLMPNDPDESRQREAKRPLVRQDVIAERIIAVVVIGAGTLLNGYATPVVRALGL